MQDDKFKDCYICSNLVQPLELTTSVTSSIKEQTDDSNEGNDQTSSRSECTTKICRRGFVGKFKPVEIKPIR